MKKALVCGAGGFIGGHMVKHLLDEGYEVVGVDIKARFDWYQTHEGCKSNKGTFDLRDPYAVREFIQRGDFDEVYQFAADMGGAGYIFTGEHDADVMHNSAMINLNLAEAISTLEKKPKVFYSSSACIYPAENQTDPDNPNCAEGSAYPANPDSEYGWEKLFSERMWKSFARNYNFEVRIARFHNIFGPFGTWDGGKEKAPAAMCRKVIQATQEEDVEVWGPGNQTRSFLYIDECLEAVRRLMESEVVEVINIGSDEMISINNLALMTASISGKEVNIKNIDGPVGVNGRNSDNTLIRELLGWAPTQPLREGMEKTYNWIEGEINYSIKKEEWIKNND
jgi:nucleoside-diphosphate-sugar epimerase